jgi:Molybdopterin oxidoreductase
MSCGALTSKPYSFSARPWELNSLESIDILDSMCSHIRLDYLNNKVMRILPIYNKTLNEDWISNKIRFVYDSNLFQRFNYPLLKVEENKFINITWLNAINIFLINLNKYIINNMNVQVIIGNLVDLELINLNKKFFNYLGIDINLESNINYFNSDLVSDFLITPLELDNIKILLLISLNLRLEIPILNSKFFRRKEQIKFFSIGITGYYYSNNIKHIGNNVNDIMKLLLGKTVFSKELFFLSFEYSQFNFFLKPIGLQILVGQTFFSIKNAFYLFKVLKNYVNKYCNNSWCNVLIFDVGKINFLFSNYIKKPINFINNMFLFLNNVDTFNFLNKFIDKNNYIVYRGCFFDEGANKSNLIFPNLTFFEDNLKYKNYYGLNSVTRKVVSNQIFNNKEFFYLLNILKYKFFKNNLYKIINFKILFKYFSKFYINFVCNKFNNKSIVVIEKNKLSFNIENKLFNSLIINFYKNDVYSRNSKNISLASLEYLKTITTYIK